ncbi:hypothetical protein C8R44DRAFT_323296 [Mycena epipterygia]|nr:hypothetical protein C8R44DRAFT_323296 [Mycena epipterygia]
MTGTYRILTPTTMSFLDLPEDVIYHALSMCDISSVICISQTSKYLHLLGLAPTVWRSLVEDLRYRGFVDRLSIADIRAMSTETSMTVVKRVVAGPEAWSPPKIQSPPQPTFFSKLLAKLVRPREQKEAVPDPPQIQPGGEIVLHPALPPVFPFKLLRGGKHALFCSGQDAAVLVCWRVADDSLLGTYQSAFPTPNIFDFEAEVFDGGERANIVMCVRAGTHEPNFVEIIHWDFATGETQLLSTTTCTDYQLCPSPKICSGLAAVRVLQNFPWAECMSSSTGIPTNIARSSVRPILETNFAWNSFQDTSSSRQSPFPLIWQQRSELVPSRPSLGPGCRSDNTIRSSPCYFRMSLFSRRRRSR